MTASLLLYGMFLMYAIVKIALILRWRLRDRDRVAVIRSDSTSIEHRVERTDPDAGIFTVDQVMAMLPADIRQALLPPPPPPGPCDKHDWVGIRSFNGYVFGMLCMECGARRYR